MPRKRSENSNDSPTVEFVIPVEESPPGESSVFSPPLSKRNSRLSLNSGGDGSGSSKRTLHEHTAPPGAGEGGLFSMTKDSNPTGALPSTGGGGLFRNLTSALPSTGGGGFLSFKPNSNSTSQPVTGKNSNGSSKTTLAATIGTTVGDGSVGIVSSKISGEPKPADPRDAQNPQQPSNSQQSSSRQQPSNSQQSSSRQQPPGNQGPSGPKRRDTRGQGTKNMIIQVSRKAVDQLVDANNSTQDHMMEAFRDGMKEDNWSEERTAKKLEKLVGKISRGRLDKLVTEASVWHSCHMDFQYDTTEENSSSGAPAPTGAHVSNSNPQANSSSGAPAPTGTPASNSNPQANSSSEAPILTDQGPKPEIFPRFVEGEESTRANVQDRIVGWYRNGIIGKNVLIWYGHIEYPLYQIVPGKVFGNGQKAAFQQAETLTDKQKKHAATFISWDSSCKITGVARSQSPKRPVMWVSINNEHWVTRSYFEGLRLNGDNDTPLGRQTASEIIMDFVKQCSTKYHAVGSEVGEEYMNDISEGFSIISAKKTKTVEPFNLQTSITNHQQNQQLNSGTDILKMMQMQMEQQAKNHEQQMQMQMQMQQQSQLLLQKLYEALSRANEL